MTQPESPTPSENSPNTPARLAQEAARPWQWSIASWGLILLGPLAAVAFVVTRSEPVVTPVRTMSQETLELNVKRQTRDGRPMVQNLVVATLPEAAGHRLTGERLPDTWRQQEANYRPFELVVPAGGVVWHEPPPEGLGRRALRAWIGNNDEPRLLAEGRPLDVPAYLAAIGVSFDQMQAPNPLTPWLVPLAVGVGAGLALAGASRLVGGPRESGFGFGDLATTDNPEPTKVDLAAIAAEQRAKAAELDGYLDSVVAGGVSEADNVETEEEADPTPAPPARQPPRTLTQDATTRHVPKNKEPASYDSGEFYPTAVGSKRG